MNKNMNSQKNIYGHNFKFNKLISNHYKRNIIYKPKMAFINVNNIGKYSSNAITDRKNSLPKF